MLNLRAMIASGVAVVVVVAAILIWRYEKSASEQAAPAMVSASIAIAIDPLEGRIDSGRVTLLGPVPDEDARRALVAEAKQRFGADNVTDALTLNPELQAILWYRSDQLYLPLTLRGLERGTVKFDGRQLTMDGFVMSANAKVEFENSANAALAGRFSLVSRVQVREPVKAVEVAAATVVPATTPAKVVQERIDRLLKEHPIDFDANSTRLNMATMNVLDQVASVIIESNARIEISGHTENVGDPEKNVRLSSDRADEVSRYLARRGVLRDRLVARGYGAAHAVAFGSDLANAPKTKRIEFRVLEER